MGVSYIVSLSYTQTACERWWGDKSCNTCSPWIKETWDCACLFGLSVPPSPRSRAVAYQMLVRMAQSATPLFRVGLGMAA